MAKPFPNEDEAFTYLGERYGASLDEARRLAIGNNLATFFATLNEWDQKLNAEKEDQNLESTTHTKTGGKNG